MNVFLTGATGFVGSATVAELIAAGHKVTGLARNEESVAKLAKMGAAAQRGDLKDLQALKTAAAAADGVIHLGFIHDFSNFAASVEIDKRAIQVLADAVRPGGVLINTQGTALLAGSTLATEETVPDPKSHLAFRLPSEQIGLAAADRGVRTAIVRLSPSVYGPGDHHGFVPMMISLARKKGIACYVGDGQNRWPTVHRLDAAKLYRLALEKAPARSVLHGVGTEATPMREIVEAIAKGVGVPARSIPVEQADEHFGWLSGFVQMDNPTSSVLTRKLLNWNSVERSLLAELRDGRYFA